MNKGEKIILRTQGLLQFRSPWQLGCLFLTNRRLLFIQGTKQSFETGLNGIVELNIVKRVMWIGVRVKQLCIAFNYGKRQERVYVALAEPENWSAMIKEHMTLILAERWGYNGANPEPPSNT